MKGGVGQNKMVNKAAGVQVQSAIVGQAVPLLYGTSRINPKLVALWDFQAHKVDAGKKAGKKGGESYTYTTACDFLLGHYPIQFLLDSWENKINWCLTRGAYSSIPTASGGSMSITIPDASILGGSENLVGILNVMVEEDYSETFDDYGSEGEHTLAGTWLRPLWNKHYRLPDGSAGSGRDPYTYEWYPGMGATVSVHPSLSGKKIIIHSASAFANLPNLVSNNGLAKLNLEFEPYLAGGSEYVSNPSQQLPYNWVSGVGSPKFDLGMSNNFSAMSFEAQGAFALSWAGDCLPSDIITDLMLSGPITAVDAPHAGELIEIGHGLALPASFLGDLSAMRDYCLAYGIFSTVYLESQQTARDVLQEQFDVANCAPVVSGSQLKAIPYCEVSACGNGGVFTAPTASGPVAFLDDDCFAVDGMPEMERTRQADADNVVKIEHLSRANQYNTCITTEVEQRSVAQFGARPTDSKTMHSIHDPEVAQKVASVMVKRASMLRGTISFKLPTTYSWLEAMDLVGIQDFRLFGSTQYKPFRLTKVSEDAEFNITGEAEPFMYGVSAPQPMEYQPVLTEVPTPYLGGPVNPPVFFEPPDSMAIPGGYNLWIAAAGASAKWGGALVWMSADGTTYSEKVPISRCVMGVAEATGASSRTATIASTSESPAGILGRNDYYTFVTFTGDHPFVDGDSVKFSGLTYATWLNGMTFTVSVTSSTQIRFVFRGSILGYGAIADTGTASAGDGMETTTDTLNVDLTESLGSLASFTSDEIAAGAGVCLLGSELISYYTAILTSAYHYTLTGVSRGLKGTEPIAHPAGTHFVFLDDNVLKMTLDSSWVGKEAHYKFTSFNTLYAQMESLDNVEDYTYNLQGKYNNVSQIVANDATVDFTSVTGTNCTVRAYGKDAGTPTPGHDVTFLRTDGTTLTSTAGSWPGSTLLTTYYAMRDPSGVLYLLASYAGMLGAVNNGHICLGSTTTPAADGTGGDTGGGGGVSGGGGNPKGGGVIYFTP